MSIDSNVRREELDSNIRIHNGSYRIDRHFAGTKTAAELIAEKLNADMKKTFSREPSLAFRRVSKYNNSTAFGQHDREGR